MCIWAKIWNVTQMNGKKISKDKKINILLKSYDFSIRFNVKLCKTLFLIKTTKESTFFFKKILRLFTFFVILFSLALLSCHILCSYWLYGLHFISIQMAFYLAFILCCLVLVVVQIEIAVVETFTLIFQVKRQISCITIERNMQCFDLKMSWPKPHYTTSTERTTKEIENFLTANTFRNAVLFVVWIWSTQLFKQLCTFAIKTAKKLKNVCFNENSNMMPKALWYDVTIKLSHFFLFCSFLLNKCVNDSGVTANESISITIKLVLVFFIIFVFGLGAAHFVCS